MDSTMKTSIPKKCYKSHEVFFFFFVNNLIVYIEMKTNFCPKKCHRNLQGFFFFFW